MKTAIEELRKLVEDSSVDPAWKKRVEKLRDWFIDEVEDDVTLELPDLVKKLAKRATEMGHPNVRVYDMPLIKDSPKYLRAALKKYAAELFDEVWKQGKDY